MCIRDRQQASRRTASRSDPDPRSYCYRRRQASRDGPPHACLLYTSDAADERSSVDLGGRRIIKKKKHNKYDSRAILNIKNIHRHPLQKRATHIRREKK